MTTCIFNRNENANHQFALYFRTGKMSIQNIKTCARLFIFLVFTLSNGFSEKFEKTTSCVYTNVAGVETFEFICDPSKYAKEFFNNGNVIYCDSNSGHSFYKERRHQIQFQNCYLKTLPVIFMWYKAVRQLNVSSLGLETLRSKNFDYAVNLLTLIASHNQLTEIPSSLFDDATKISEVDFSFNKINRIDTFAFNAENNITSLNLSNNLIVEIDNRTFGKLSRLEVLNLSFNRMTTLSEGLFDELIHLKQLDLANNLLKQLKCSIFANSINLTILNLTRNKLQIFDSNCVQSENTFAVLVDSNELQNLILSQNVSEIHASANNITTIFIEQGLENLIVFNVSKNNVDNVPEILRHLGSQLRILDVSDSTVGKFNVSTLDKFDNLEHLSLRNTSLSNIQYGTFHHQQKLRYLDLSNNDLEKINFVMLHWSLGQLEKLYVDGNNLNDLNNLTKANYPSLQYISIDNNNFDCDYLSEIQHLWKNDGISIIFNPHITSQLQATTTHINGITCYHGSVASTMAIIENEQNGGTNVTDRADSMWKIEILLLCIAVVLSCLLVVTITKNFVPVFRRYRMPQTTANEQVYYKSKMDEQSLI